MSLKKKAANLSLENLDDDTPSLEAGEQPEADRPRQQPAEGEATSTRKARSGVAAISHSIGMHHRVQDLEAQVAAFEAGGVIVPLDPKLIRPSKWKNRHSLSFATAKYQELKAEIEGAGGNVQAIKVRRVERAADDGFEFEIVYGRRRHRACLELGLPVDAVVATLTDLEVFQEMERENRNREDLTAWEQGVMYKDAIDTGLFPSQRQLAAALGLDQSNLGKAIKLASLPHEIVDAFASPLDLQFRWGQELSDALDKDPAKVLTVAAEIGRETPRPASKEVFARLIGASTGRTDLPPRQFAVGGRPVATWAKDLKGAGSLKVKAGVLTASKERRLLEFLEKLFE